MRSRRTEYGSGLPASAALKPETGDFYYLELRKSGMGRDPAETESDRIDEINGDATSRHGRARCP
jgi:hypothetical protein